MTFPFRCRVGDAFWVMVWEVHQGFPGWTIWQEVGCRLPSHHPNTPTPQSSPYTAVDDSTRSNERARQTVWHFYEASGMDKDARCRRRRKDMFQQTLNGVPYIPVLHAYKQNHTIRVYSAATIELLTFLYYYIVSRRFLSFGLFGYAFRLASSLRQCSTHHQIQNSATDWRYLAKGSLVSKFARRAFRFENWLWLIRFGWVWYMRSELHTQHIYMHKCKLDLFDCLCFCFIYIMFSSIGHRVWNIKIILRNKLIDV